jgi:hypothetical protein
MQKRNFCSIREKLGWEKKTILAKKNKEAKYRGVRKKRNYHAEKLG